MVEDGASPTTVRVLAGSSVGESISDTSLLVDDNSFADVFGGTFEQDLFAQRNGTLRLYDGTVDDDFIVIDNGVGVIFGGSVADDVEAENNASITIFGGSFGEDVEASDQSTISIFGGSYATAGLGNQDTGLAARGLGTIFVYGVGFQIDGSDVGFGEISATSGVLTGTLSDGTALETNIVRDRQRVGFRFPRGTIVLVEQAVPTPGSVAVAVVAGLACAVRRRGARGV